MTKFFIKAARRAKIFSIIVYCCCIQDEKLYNYIINRQRVLNNINRIEIYTSGFFSLVMLYLQKKYMEKFLGGWKKFRAMLKFFEPGAPLL